MPGEIIFSLVESDDSEYSDDSGEEMNDDFLGPIKLFVEGFLGMAPNDKGTIEFQNRIHEMIITVQKLVDKVFRVFMSPGPELVVFDSLKERLWSSYLFYA